MAVLGRDPDYISLNIQFTIDVLVTAGIINMFPTLLKPYVFFRLGRLSSIELYLNRVVGRGISRLPAYLKRAEKHLSPIFEARLQQEAQHGKNWPEKPVCSIIQTILVPLVTLESHRTTLLHGSWIELILTRESQMTPSAACWLSTWLPFTRRPL
jgi:hypothetical protein